MRFIPTDEGIPEDEIVSCGVDGKIIIWKKDQHVTNFLFNL